ncbi:hypothetical protein DFH06DRAFT_1221927, partial [Mycena polygramma]
GRCPRRRCSGGLCTSGRRSTIAIAPTHAPTAYERRRGECASTSTPRRCTQLHRWEPQPPCFVARPSSTRGTAKEVEREGRARIVVAGENREVDRSAPPCGARRPPYVECAGHAGQFREARISGLWWGYTLLDPEGRDTSLVRLAGDGVANTYTGDGSPSSARKASRKLKNRCSLFEQYRRRSAALGPPGAETRVDGSSSLMSKGAVVHRAPIESEIPRPASGRTSEQRARYWHPRLACPRLKILCVATALEQGLQSGVPAITTACTRARVDLCVRVARREPTREQHRLGRDVRRSPESDCKEIRSIYPHAYARARGWRTLRCRRG